MKMASDYSGSRLLEGLCPYLGLSLSQLNFLTAELFSLAAAVVFNAVLPVERVGVSVRHMVLTFLGLSLCLFCFGSLTILLILQVALCYAAILFCPHPHMHRFVFVLVMSYLMVWHVYSFFNESVVDLLSIGGPLMVCTQKLTMVAFGLSDGQNADRSKLSEEQRQQAVSEVPSPLKFFSYTLHFQSLLAGPFSFYNDYCAYVDGSHFQKFYSKTKENKVPVIPSAKRAVMGKTTLAIICAAIYMIILPKVEFTLIMNDEFTVKTPFFKKIFYVWLVIALKRCMYYIPWLLGDAVCNASGFGFNGYDDNGRAKWDLVTIVDVTKIETATSFKALLDAWHISSARWLRYVCFYRTPTRWRMALTFLLSAVWHGIRPGIYFLFLHAILVTYVSRLLRRNLRPLFQTSEFSKRLYDVITWTAVALQLSYFGMVFHMYSFVPTLSYLNSMYWYAHIIIAVVLALDAFGFWRSLSRYATTEINSNTGKTHTS